MGTVRNYAALPHEYLEEMSVLSDAEFGRLVRSLLQYSKDGTPIALNGNERFYAVRAMNCEDRFQKSFQESDEKLRKAGQAGAIARWNKDTTACDGMRSDATACDGMRSDAIDAFQYQTETNTNTNTETKTKSKTPLTPQRRNEMIGQGLDGRSGQLVIAVGDWVQYKIERREPYQETGLRNLISQIRKAAEQHGDNAVIDVIRNSMGSGYKGILFDRLGREKPKQVTTASEYKPPAPPKSAQDIWNLVDKI